MMHMTFYWSKQALILFDGWRTKTWLDYALSLLALFLAAVFHEYAASRRTMLKQGIQSSSSSKGSGTRQALLGSASSSSSSSVAAAKTRVKVLDSVLFGLTTALGYLLMLAAMSFNGGVFLSIVFGFAVGYFVFRSGEAIKNVVDDDDSCCN